MIYKPLILIVDDEHANQFLLQGLLSANGYETITATDGEECLKILEKNKPDLILLDIMMPRMSGIQVLQKINEIDELMLIPVIMVSAKTSTPDIERALEMGAIDYIKKPFEEIELLARVKSGIRLKLKEDRLREMIAQREDFIRIVSHDLRSPFTAIDGFASMLMHDENLNPDQKDSIQQIIDSVGFSQEYFNKLLSWARLEKDEIELNKKPVNLEKLVNSVLPFHEKKAGKKSITLAIVMDPDHTVLADEVFLRQVIENLISNAIKFTPSGGAVKCTSIIRDDGLQLIISDTGIGMPENLTPNDFTAMNFQPSRRGTNNEKGTGIGLGICKKILDVHGFGIRFNKNNTGGTDFIITMRS
jgi:two-component system, sensor histidine kinase and response regulator